MEQTAYKLQARNLLPITGVNNYISRMGEIQQKLGRDYEDIRPNVRVRAIGLIAYNMAVFSSTALLIWEGLEKLLN